METSFIYFSVGLSHKTPDSLGPLSTYNLKVKNEAPTVGLTFLLKIFPTYLTTRLVFPTPVNSLRRDIVTFLQWQYAKIQNASTENCS